MVIKEYARGADRAILSEKRQTNAVSALPAHQDDRSTGRDLLFWQNASHETKTAFPVDRTLIYLLAVAIVRAFLPTAKAVGWYVSKTHG
ncbi:hypothetical protein [Flaviaesturariibacter amylovorans]|uniref:hypothetical protein n=1 Tax=Flaviaesturariibacter amylovorans TaxID=1084520 RepID=UPI0031EFF24F